MKFLPAVLRTPHIALGLDPFGPRSRPIWGVRALRHDAFEAKFARVLKYRCAVALKVFGVSDEVQPKP